ncbi:MAG: hypothetical protein JSS68_09355 [Actinobacteria bacterium]|nr:hypothetical protein [Actinomycetota bacterium]MBS1882926.1 hypothetical protein [Actinomycetota bacterium]
MRRPFARRAEAAPFTLDRERFAAATREELGELRGAAADGEGGIGMALARRFHDAFYAGAVDGPPGVEVMVYAFADSVMVTVREDVPPPGGLPWRQVSTYSFEARYVIDAGDESFEETCAAIEALLDCASTLLPSFEAMRRGEEDLEGRGRRRRFSRLRRLSRAASR